MGAADREEYFKMSREFYRSGAAREEIPQSRRENFWREIVRGELVHGYIIEHGGVTAGYALAAYYCSQEFGGKVLFLDELFIKGEFRGLGLAKRFLTFIEGENDVVLSRLEVERGNERAVGLYRSLGYETLDYMQMIKKLRD